jgi:hypothetical protein
MPNGWCGILLIPNAAIFNSIRTKATKCILSGIKRIPFHLGFWGVTDLVSGQNQRRIAMKGIPLARFNLTRAGICRSLPRGTAILAPQQALKTEP